MERLCSVTNVWKGLKKQHPKEHLSRRLKECENFTARQELLTFLCNQVTVPVVGRCMLSTVIVFTNVLAFLFSNCF